MYDDLIFKYFIPPLDTSIMFIEFGSLTLLGKFVSTKSPNPHSPKIPLPHPYNS